MSDPRPRFIVAVAALAASIVIGTSTALLARSPAPTDGTGGAASAMPVEADTAIALGEPFALAVGETAFLEDGLSVTFVSVVTDSRCPSDVECVWEGDAEMAIEVATSGGDRGSVRLHTNASFGREASFLSYSIELIDLQPYPRTDREPEVPYVAMIVVDPVGADPTGRPDASPSPPMPEARAT